MPKLGDKAYEVEWCIHCPLDCAGEALLDCAVYKTAVVKTIQEARNKAKEVYPLDWFGSVRITSVQWSDQFGDGLAWLFGWEYFGDSEYYSGD
jgi:hypothetical protein